MRRLSKNRAKFTNSEIQLLFLEPRYKCIICRCDDVTLPDGLLRLERVQSRRRKEQTELTAHTQNSASGGSAVSLVGIYDPHCGRRVSKDGLFVTQRGNLREFLLGNGGFDYGI